MKDRPILFSAPMVRALLVGTKTQTRRSMNPQPIPWANGWQLPGYCSSHEDAFRHGAPIFKSKFGKPGDRLWVRETHAPQADCWGSWERWARGECGPAPIIHFAADAEKSPFIERWRPSIHMPRWASRITLEITAVRAERLHDISEADARAEGISPFNDGHGWHTEDGRHYAGTAADAYLSLWATINGEASARANPWVWVIEFKKVST